MSVGLNLNYSVGRVTYAREERNDTVTMGSGESSGFNVVVGDEERSGSNNLTIVVGVLVPVVAIIGAVIALVVLLLLYLRTKHHRSSHSLSQKVEGVELQEGKVSVILYSCENDLFITRLKGHYL